MHDAYEKQAEGIAGALCPSCHTVKPMSKFKRKLTRAQAYARGYTGAVLVEIESKFCVECRPKRKSTRKLTKKELMNKMATSDLNELTVKLELKRRHTEARALQRRAVNARWDRVRAKPWMDLVKDINEEITAVKHQRYYADKRGVMDLHKFAEAYEQVLIKQRAQFRIYARTQNKKGDAPPESWWWPDYIKHDNIEEIKKLWMEIPAARQQLTRVPLVFRNTEKPESNPHDKEDRLTQAKARLKTYD